jgi:putative copper export protein
MPEASYGRVLIVKSALFVPLLALGRLNRTLLLGQFPRFRRSAVLELVVLLGIVVAVAVLTELGPGKTTLCCAREHAASGRRGAHAPHP